MEEENDSGGVVPQPAAEIVAQKPSPFAGREPRAASQWEHEVMVQRAADREQETQAKTHGLVSRCRA